MASILFLQQLKDNIKIFNLEHIQIQIRKTAGRVPTWGGWASAFHVHKAVVVCDDVTLFQCFPYILVTLKEQFRLDLALTVYLNSWPVVYPDEDA